MKMHLDKRHDADLSGPTIEEGHCEQPTYAWLNSEYGSHVWTITDSQGTECELRWDVRFHDGTLLTDPQHSHLFNIARAVTTNIRTGPFATLDDAATQHGTARSLLIMTQWMRLNNVDRYDRLTPADFDDFRECAIYGYATLLNAPTRIRNVAMRYREQGVQPPSRAQSSVRVLDRAAVLADAGLDPIFKPEITYELDLIAHEFGLYLTPNRKARLEQGPPPSKKVVNTTLGLALQSWELLWRQRNMLPPGTLSFNPFEDFGSAFAIAAIDARQSGRTRTIPALQAMCLIDRSVRWVLHYADDLLNLRDMLLEADIEQARRKPVDREFTLHALSCYIAEHEPSGQLPVWGGRLSISQIANAIGVPPGRLLEFSAARELLDALSLRIGLEPDVTATPDDPDSLLTIQQAARYFEIEPRTLRDRLTRGALVDHGSPGAPRIRFADMLHQIPPKKKAHPHTLPPSDTSLTRFYARIIQSFRPLTKGPGDPWPLAPGVTKNTTGGAVDVNTAVNQFLPVACIIVICAFSARRHHEVTGLQHKPKPGWDVIMGEPGERWLAVWIEKTVRDWDLVPVPEIVVKAVDVLQRWSEPARIETGQPGLFQWPNWRGGAPNYVWSTKGALRTFVDHLDIPEVPGKGPWQFSTHQFRRFFAMLYMWRYEAEGKSLEALSWMLRHANIETTRIYVSESEEGAIFHKMQVQETKEVLTAIAKRERKAGGGFVSTFLTAIDRMTEEVKRAIKVVPESRIQRLVNQYVEEHQIILKPFAWGFCTCANNAAATATANCRNGQDLTDKIGPDHAVAKPSICAFCPHNMTGPQFNNAWRNQLVQLKYSAEDPNNSVLMQDQSRLEYERIRRYAQEAVLLEDDDVS